LSLIPGFLIAGSSPSSSSSNSVNPIASLGALQTLAGATAGLNVGSLAGKGQPLVVMKPFLMEVAYLKQPWYRLRKIRNNCGILSQT
jgi:hypothetical protein